MQELTAWQAKSFADITWLKNFTLSWTSGVHICENKSTAMKQDKGEMEASAACMHIQLKHMSQLNGIFPLWE